MPEAIIEKQIEERNMHEEDVCQQVCMNIGDMVRINNKLTNLYLRPLSFSKNSDD